MLPGPRGYPGPYAYPGMEPVLTEYDTNFYVGPLGALRALPSTSDPVAAPLTVIGGTHTSLTGAFTRDTFGFQRQWAWGYKGLTDRQTLYVEALARGLVSGPLYLLDPRRPNRLPEQIASGGSQLRSTVGFIPSNTTACLWRPLRGAPPSSTTLPMAPLVRGCLEWQLLSFGGGGLELAGFSGDGRHDVPLLAGEALEVSAWVAGQPGGAVSVEVTIYDATGAAVTDVASSPVAVNLTNWQRAAVSVVCPASATYLRVQLLASAASPVGSMFLTGLQVAPSGVSYVPGLQQFCPEDDFGGWSLGGGAPQVVAGAATSGSSYIVPGIQTAGLTLIERSFAATVVTLLPTGITSGGGGTLVVPPVMATRWVGGVFDGMTSATDSWQSTTPVVETNVSAFTSQRALHIVEAANGSSTPGGTAAAPSGAYQRCESYVDMSHVSGIDVDGEIEPGFSGYFGLSVYLDSDFPTNPRETGGGAAWQLITQWKNDGTGSPPLELNIQNGRLSLGGNSAGWTIDICPVVPGTRYDIICGLTFTTTASTSSASVWVNNVKYVNSASPNGAGFLYSGQPSYWKVGVYRETGIANQARASAWYGAVCFDTSQATVAAYLSAT